MERMDNSGPARRGPAEAPDAWGYDEAPERRPGVPMAAEPRPVEGVAWDSPPRQQSEVAHLHRKGVERLTPVYGATLPPKGLSGVMRRAAYEIPEHSPIHWMMLLAADRVDVLEDRLLHGGGPGTMDAIGRQVRNNPLPALVLALAAGLAVRRALR